MRNYINIPSTKRRRYLNTAIICTIVSVLIGFMSVLLLFPDYTEASDFTPITATVKSVAEEDDGYYITTEEYTLPLWISSVTVEGTDIDALKAIPQGAQIEVKAATLDLEAETFDIYIGALTHNGTDILKLEDAIRLQKDNILIGQIFVFSILALVVAGMIVGWILYAKHKKEQTESIFSIIARSAIGPQAPERKRFIIITVILSIAMVVLITTFGILSDTVSESFDIGVLISGGVFIAGLIVMVAGVNPWVKKKEIQMYDDLFSFSKEVLPPVSFDVSFDHANGRTFVFTQTGIIPLSEQDEEAFLENHFKATMQGQFQEEAAFEEYSEVPSIPQYLDTTNLVPYSELSFKALAFFANAPTRITVIITAETEKHFPLSTHDICFVLDGDLYCTLKKYNVEVQGLDEVISRRRELMQKAKSPTPKLFTSDKQ